MKKAKYNISKSLNPEDLPSASFTMIGGDHYTKLDVQPWDAMQSWFPEKSFRDYLLMNAVKYIARDKGNKVEDIQKAHHYLEKWLELTNG